VRSDDVIAIEPVTEGRGPQRRARVWVRGVPHPITASRSEAAIAADLFAVNRGRVQAGRLRSMLKELSDAIDEGAAA
jgi:hypothetical protein